MEIKAHGLRYYVYSERGVELVEECAHPTFDIVSRFAKKIYEGNQFDCLHIFWADSEVKITKVNVHTYVTTSRLFGSYFFISDPSKDLGTIEIVEFDDQSSSFIDSSTFLSQDFVSSLLSTLFGVQTNSSFRLIK